MAIETVTTPVLHKRPIALQTLDELSAAAAKLDALLTGTYGNSGDAFRDMNDELQDNYLWACAGIAEEIKRLVSSI